MRSDVRKSQESLINDSTCTYTIHVGEGLLQMQSHSSWGNWHFALCPTTVGCLLDCIVLCVSLSPNIHDNCTSSSPCLSVWTSYSPFLFSLSHSFIFVSMFVHRRWCNLSHQWCSCLLFICWSCAQFYGTCQTGKISTRGNSPLINGLQGQMSWRLMVHKTYMFTLFGGPTCTIGLTSQSRPNVSVLYNWQLDMQ